MKPLEMLAQETTAEGDRLVLYRRDGVYFLRVDGLELMSSRAHGSEQALARLACAAIGKRSRPRVLIGGLGFGYTLRAALDLLPPAAEITVCELFAMLLELNRGELGALARHPLHDRRVRVRHGDVWDLIEPGSAFDAILLDVDNGPWAFTVPGNERLYTLRGLRRCASALTPAGILAVWSSGASREFERRLVRAGFTFTTERISARDSGKGPWHTIFVARGPRPTRS